MCKLQHNLEAVCRLLWEKFSFMLVHYNPALSEAQIILYQKIPNAQTSVSTDLITMYICLKRFSTLFTVNRTQEKKI
jgi:hypothetical protein